MKEIEINGITILIVEIPDDVLVRIDNDELSYQKTVDSEPTFIELPYFQWQILGKSTELSEEHMKEIVKPFSINRMIYTGALETVQEAYLYLLEANGIVDRCDIKKPEFNYEFGEDGPTDSQLLSAEIHFEESFRQWQEAQSKVKTYLVLKRI